MLETIKSMRPSVVVSSILASLFLVAFTLLAHRGVSVITLEDLFNKIDEGGLDAVLIGICFFSSLCFCYSLGAISSEIAEEKLLNAKKIAPQNLEPWQKNRIYTIKAVGTYKILLIDSQGQEKELDKREFFNHWKILE